MEFDIGINERDMDMLIADEISASKKFAGIFMKAIGITEFEVTGIYRSVAEKTEKDSKTDYHGETDILVEYLVPGNEKCNALLIEDKIDFEGMPNQPDRYAKRCEQYEDIKKYNHCDYLLVSPQSYRDNNKLAKDYTIFIPYEVLLNYFINSDTPYKDIKCDHIRRAIDKYEVLPTDEEFVKGWNIFHTYIQGKYPHIIFQKGNKRTRGAGLNVCEKNSKSWISYFVEAGTIRLNYPKSKDKQISELLKECFLKHVQEMSYKHYEINPDNTALFFKVPKISMKEIADNNNVTEDIKDKVNKCMEILAPLYEINKQISLEMKNIRCRK